MAWVIVPRRELTWSGGRKSAGWLVRELTRCKASRRNGRRRRRKRQQLFACFGGRRKGRAATLEVGHCGSNKLE